MLDYYVIFAVIILFGFSITISFLNLKIKINFIRKGDNDDINISLYILKGLLKYKVTIPFIDIINSIDNNEFIKTQVYRKTQVLKEQKIFKKANKKELNFNEMKLLAEKFLDFRRKYLETIKYIMKKIAIDNIYWWTEIGLEDAADTAVLSGILWGIKSNLIMFLKRKYKLDYIYIDIKPYYTEKKLNVIFSCIVTLKLGYIIMTGIKLLLIRIKGGERLERSSN